VITLNYQRSDSVLRQDVDADIVEIFDRFLAPPDTGAATIA